MLPAWLEAAYKERENRQRKKQDLEKEIEGRTATVIAVFKNWAATKQLQEEKEKRQNLIQKVEIMFIQAPHPLNILQNRKLVVFSKDFDGDPWS